MKIYNGRRKLLTGYYLVFLLIAAYLAACGKAGAPQFSEADLGTVLAVLELQYTATAAAVKQEGEGPGATCTSTPTLGKPASTPTQISMTGPHRDGVYLVGVEIAKGLWRSVQSANAETETFCFFARRKYDGVVLGSYYGLPGPDLLVGAGDYEVEMEGCGVWVYLGER
jgi:hypothetical protein